MPYKEYSSEEWLKLVSTKNFINRKILIESGIQEDEYASLFPTVSTMKIEILKSSLGQLSHPWQIQLLFKKSVDLNSILEEKDKNNNNIAHYAALGANINALQWLIDHQHPHLLKAGNSKGDYQALLEFAALSGDKKVFEWINTNVINIQALLKKNSSYNFSLIYHAALSGTAEILQWLEENGLKDELKKNFASMIDGALQGHNFKALLWIEEKGWDIDMQKKERPPLIFSAAPTSYNHIEQIAFRNLFISTYDESDKENVAIQMDNLIALYNLIIELKKDREVFYIPENNGDAYMGGGSYPLQNDQSEFLLKILAHNFTITTVKTSSCHQPHLKEKIELIGKRNIEIAKRHPEFKALAYLFCYNNNNGRPMPTELLLQIFQECFPKDISKNKLVDVLSKIIANLEYSADNVVKILSDYVYKNHFGKEKNNLVRHFLNDFKEFFKKNIFTLSPEEFNNMKKQIVIDFYKANKEVINKQRNPLHTFFNSDHKTELNKTFDNIFKDLGISETDLNNDQKMEMSI